MVLVGRISLGDWGWSPSISRSQLFDGYEPIETDKPMEKKKRGRPRKPVVRVSVVCPFIPRRVILGEVISQ